MNEWLAWDRDTGVVVVVNVVVWQSGNHHHLSVCGDLYLCSSTSPDSYTRCTWGKVAKQQKESEAQGRDKIAFWLVVILVAGLTVSGCSLGVQATTTDARREEDEEFCNRRCTLLRGCCSPCEEHTTRELKIRGRGRSRRSGRYEWTWGMRNWKNGRPRSNKLQRSFNLDRWALWWSRWSYRRNHLHDICELMPVCLSVLLRGKVRYSWSPNGFHDRPPP